MRRITFLIALALGCDGDTDTTDAGDTDDTTPIDTDVPVNPDSDGDGHTSEAAGGDDCNDDDQFIHPDAIEHCDGIDENCNDIIDDNPIDGTLYFEDADDDGYGAPGTSVLSCDGGAGVADNDDDCDDDNPELNPGADEICNGGYDDDCDPDSLETGMIGTRGFSSLNDALVAAVDGDTIELCEGSHYTKAVIVDRDVTISGAGGDRTMSTLDGGVAGDGAMLIVDGGDLTLEHVTVINANDGALAALTIGGGDITIDDCLFLANDSPDNGGAIAGTTITITNSDFVDNTGNNGGAVYASSPGVLTITDSTFDGNEADTDGGGFYTSAAATLTGVTFTANEALNYGGGGAASGGQAFLTLAGTTFSGNTAVSGGALVMTGASGTADVATTFDANLAISTGFDNSYGGGLYVLANGNDVTWSGGLFTANVNDSENFAAGGGVTLDASSAVGAGGGSIEASDIVADSNVTIEPGGFNTGGGIWMAGAPITLSDTVTTNNISNYGGGTSINTTAGGLITLERVEFRWNTGGFAGATDVYDANASLVDCVVEENIGGVGFGAIMVDLDGTLDVTSSDFGEGATDNSPFDVYVNNVPKRSYDFGADATFSCEYDTGMCL